MRRLKLFAIRFFRSHLPRLVFLGFTSFFLFVPRRRRHTFVGLKHIPWSRTLSGTLLGPRAYSSYMASLQARGLWPVSVIAAANRIVLPLTWLGLLALGIASWLLRDRDSCSLVAFVTAGYAANALICSSVSGVHE